MQEAKVVQGNVSGDAHICCNFNWRKSELKPPKPNPHGVQKGWYIFPVNFDPAWQQEECKAHADKREPSMTIDGEDIFYFMQNLFK